MKKERISVNGVGGCSLLTVFGVLCLTVLALLSYSSALAEKRLSDAAAEAVKACYLAELEGETVRSRLNNGESVPGIQQQENSVMYTVPISDHQYLEVKLVKTEFGWQVKRWQNKVKQREIAGVIPVYTGDQGGGS
ncbi:MAG: hypothetical protein IKJ84_00595 [Oscillospiraceae bacterium]|nr:hypothetical protein [Oscillospiraceae bacterium]